VVELEWQGGQDAFMSKTYNLMVIGHSELTTERRFTAQVYLNTTELYSHPAG